MRVVCCSSGCCAVKHIRDFYCDPDMMINTIDSEGHDEDTSSSEPSAYLSWERSSYGKAPAKDVFISLVAQIKERRPAGIITVNLAADNNPEEWCCEDCDGPKEDFNKDEDFDRSRVNAWEPIFLAEGFTKIVTLNSNSGNEIHHYTLAYDMGNWEA